MGPEIINRTNPFMSLRRTRRAGYTLIELLMTCTIIAILAGIAISSFQVVKEHAYKVTLQHDLHDFVNAQEAYATDHRRYLGAAGDLIQGGPPPSGSLMVQGFPFVPSAGVSVEIISGDGQDYMGSSPFVAIAKHPKLKVYYEYDFAVRKMMEIKE
jgi:prepilin-type N-terminal cleavage/methylation domain-containing protein